MRTPSIPGFERVELIGSGGLGDVFRAARVSSGRLVAIKTLRDVSDPDAAVRRVRREVEALEVLKGHPNVVEIDEFVDVDGIPGFVMEYLQAGSVQDRLGLQPGGLPIGEVVLVGRHVAAALVAGHSLGIVHRDVKPLNLLVGAFGQIKLCDFGIAAVSRTEEFRTRTSALSLQYASPEELDDDPMIGPPADVYSLGATLAHLLTGRPLSFRERTGVNGVVDPSGLPDDVDPLVIAELDGLLTAMLELEPSARPTAAEVEQHLETIGVGLGPHRVPALPDASTPSSPQHQDADAGRDRILDGAHGNHPPERSAPI